MSNGTAREPINGRPVLRLGPRTPSRGPLRDVAEDLARSLDGEVRFGAADRAVYSTDASNYRHLPIGVVVPAHAEDVIRTIAACVEAGIPLLPRGAGTSLAGQACNEAVVMDLTKYMTRIVSIDASARTARVQPGVVLDDLRRAAQRLDPPLTFAADPATHDRCTLGGMIGNDSCGVHSLMAEFRGPGPRTAHSIRELDIVTVAGERMRVGPATEEELDGVVAAGGARGRLYAALRALCERYAGPIRTGFPPLSRRVSGYSLDRLLPEHGFDVAKALVGTEGTCATVLEATLELVPSPPVRSSVVLGFEDVYRAADAVPAIRQLEPLGLEGFDDRLVDDNLRKGMNLEAVRALPDGRGWLIVEVGGDDEAEARDLGREVLTAARRLPGLTGAELLEGAERTHAVWGVRESGLGATAFVPGKPDRWEGWEDAAVPPEELGAYLRGMQGLLDRFGYQTSLYGHFGQGCVHCRISFDFTTAEGVARFREFVTEAAALVVERRGSLSGEHGDGQARAELLPMMFGDELVRAFGEFKAIWDPRGLMNPGRVVEPSGLDRDLRLGPDRRPVAVTTRFAFPEDGGSFAHALTRCVGVGSCRRDEGGTMCPSYRVTREEEHSTRGRARLLFEMLHGRELEPWRSAEVKEALDLCLACKGCKGDCPVGVDMATYKAEFLSHYYQGRSRPRVAYAMGLMPWWARAAGRAPRLVNAAARAPFVSTLVKRAVGIAPQRELPRVGGRTFRAWFRGREARPSGDEVVLWPDTFTDRFHPEAGIAAVHVLEALGARVLLPDRWVCCGRPLYDFGMLDLAERVLRRSLRVLHPHLVSGTPIVGLEPSCVAVFRDEAPNLLGGDPDAERARSQVLTLSEHLDAHGFAPAPIGGRAIVQLHCHQKAVIGVEADRRLMRALGIDVEEPEPGCCGMAGAFGFESGAKYEVSMRIGERALLPTVRSAGEDRLLIADGFSCRTQIEQGTGRRPRHLAEVLAGAIGAAP